MRSEGHELIGARPEKKYYPDLLISKKIITELKSVKVLNSEYERSPVSLERLSERHTLIRHSSFGFKVLIPRNVY